MITKQELERYVEVTAKDLGIEVPDIVIKDNLRQDTEVLAVSIWGKINIVEDFQVIFVDPIVLTFHLCAAYDIIDHELIHLFTREDDDGEIFQATCREMEIPLVNEITLEEMIR